MQSEINHLISPISLNIQTNHNIEALNKNSQIYDDPHFSDQIAPSLAIPNFSEDNKDESKNENINVEEFFEEKVLENNESYSDELDQRYFIEKSIPQNSVENVFQSQLNVNEEQFQKDYLNEKRNKSQNIESEKPKKKRSNHDYLIKSFLSDSINNYILNKMNNLVKNLGLGKIYKCNYNKNIKAKESHLSSLLQNTIEEIFSIYDEKENKEYAKGKMNKKIFESFFERISNKINLSEDKEKLFNLLRSIYEDQVKLYYESKEIEKFKNKKLKHGTPVDYDKKFYFETNRRYYLLESDGFIRYAKSKPYCHNERKNKYKFY